MGQVIQFGSVPDWIKGSGSGSGSGYGSGDGDGYGSGYGYGYGSGSGDGDGSGSGYGYGSGDGSGSGSGSGSGYGYGDGDGYGSGDGSGYGYGSKDYWVGCIPHFAAKWPAKQQSRLDTVRRAGATIAYWRSDERGRACNGGSNKPVGPGTIEEIAGPLVLCGSGALHATLIPPKWKGERWWIVALHGDVVEDEDKLGALKREVLGEAL